MKKPLFSLPSSFKTVLVRADLNVPIKEGKVLDKTRLEHIKPTLDWLRKQDHGILLLSHFGRPKGKPQPTYSLKQILPDLEKVLGYPVRFIDWGGEVALKSGEVALYENLRFDPGEESNDPEFARSLAAFGECFVNEAFSASHRAHASIVGIPSLLPSFMGLGFEKEISYLSQVLENPVRPVVAIVGGAKISTKLTLIENLMKKTEHVVLGGAMASTFLKAKGYQIGQSLYEEDMVEVAQKLMDAQESTNCQLHFPLDVVAAPSLEQPDQAHVYELDAIPQDVSIYDGGPKSMKAFKEFLNGMKTVLWNGPFGVFEVPPFDEGTNKAAQAVAELTRSKNLISVAGGGDTVAALNHAGCLKDFTYVSTAGGAFLEWLEGKELPGMKALEGESIQTI